MRYWFIQWLKEWCSLALMTVVPQHVSGEECARNIGGQTTIKNDYSANTVDNGLCDVGLEGIPDKGVLTPISSNMKPVKQKSKMMKTSIPRHSHTFASKHGRSSQRTRAAAGAFYKWCSSTLVKRHTMRRRIRYFWKKRSKQQSKLIHITETDNMKKARAKFSDAYLRRNVVVFDGGDRGVPTLNGSGAKWKSTRIEGGDLEICNPSCSRVGIAYEIEEGEPVFILLPRDESIKINSNGKKLCDAMRKVMKETNNIPRGNSKQVFSDSKYCCLGAKPRRAAPGVTPRIYREEDGVLKEDWDEMITAITRGEYAFERYAGTDAICRIREAREVVEWETPKKASKTNNARVFNAVAFGMNVFLRAHVDHDFTYSVIQAHVEGMEYGVDDRTVCYFCFPKHGIAVPLRPGDFLLVNALEYHCVSSRCRRDVDVFVLSCYLKTVVVGGNDNKQKLSKNEMECSREYDNILQKNKKRKR